MPTSEIQDNSEIIEEKEWEDEDGHKKEITHQNRLKTKLLLEPSQQYIDTKLKPRQQHMEERRKRERASILAALMRDRDILEKAKNDSSIPKDYRDLMKDKLERIEAQIEKVKEEMEN